MTFIDPVAGWFEIAQVPDHETSSARISQLFNQTWLKKYILITIQNLRFLKIYLLEDFAVKPKPTSIKSPQIDGIV